MAHIKTKNSELEIRSLACLSHENSTYKKFKLEVSVLDCKVVYDPDFWQWGMRVRPYYRKKGKDDEKKDIFRTEEVENSEDDEDDS